MPLYNYQGGNRDPLNFDVFGNANSYQQFKADQFLNTRAGIPGWTGQGIPGARLDPNMMYLGGSPTFDETGGRGSPATPAPYKSAGAGFQLPAMGPLGVQPPKMDSIYGGGGAAMPYQFAALNYPTPGTNVTGGPVGGGATGWTPQYGGVPNVANPLMGEAGALYGNLTNFPLISSLAGGINQEQQGQLLANYEQAFPGFGANMAAGSAGIAHDIAGTVDPSEYAQMAIGAAGRGLAMGQPGNTPMTNAAYLSAIGQTAAQRRALGQTELNQRIAATPVVQPYDVTREFVTGQQLTDAANMANLYAAAPNPTAQAAEEQRLADVAMSRGLSAQDWLAERNYGRSQQEQALNFQRSLQSMVLGGQLSEQQANNAWQRAMAYLQSQKEPQQNRPWMVPNLYSYNRGNPTEFYSDISFSGGAPGAVGGPTTKGLLTPEQTKAYYDAWYGTGAPASATPASYYDATSDTSNMYPVNYYS